jgi:hypothetical protein
MPETDQAVTTGELSRAVEAIRGDIGLLRTDVNLRPSWQDLRRVEEGLRRDAAAAQVNQDLKNQLQDKALDALEDWNKWALRLGAPAILAAVVGMAANAIRLAGT